MTFSVTVKKWHAVGSWTWNAGDDVCGICRCARIPIALKIPEIAYIDRKHPYYHPGLTRENIHTAKRRATVRWSFQLPADTHENLQPGPSSGISHLNMESSYPTWNGGVRQMHFTSVITGIHVCGTQHF